MALEYSAGVAVGLGLSALVALGAPAALFLVLWRRHGASPKAWLFGALTFVVSQLVLRLPWQLPLNAWLVKHYRDDALVMGGWLAASALTAGLFEELGRLAAYRLLWKDRSTLGGVMLGAGHGGIESILLIGLSLVSSTVLYVLLWQGVPLPFPPDARAAIEAQFAPVTPALASLGGVERLLAMALHVACSLLVLEAVRRARWTWVATAIALHAGSNGLVLAVTKLAGPLVGELVLAAVVGPALWAALRQSRAGDRAVPVALKVGPADPQ